MRTGLKKETLKEDKSNPIAQKLLGANITDVDVEKIRSQKQSQLAINLKGTLTKPALKALSNKFSCEVIFNLNISNQTLKVISLLTECPNLMILNISNNLISDLTPLQTLTALKYLNASNNSIYNLEPLQPLVNLINLQLQGNQISSLMQLEPIKYLENLKTLYLQTLSGNQQNSVCSQATYRKDIFNYCPKLKRLDGLPKEISSLPLASEIKDKKQLDFTLTGPDYWFTDKYPNLNAQKINIEGENDLDKQIRICKEMCCQCEEAFKNP